MQASLDGKPQTLRCDRWDRLVFDVATPGQTLSLQYRPNWVTGAVLGLVCAAIACGLMLYHRHLLRATGLS